MNKYLSMRAQKILLNGLKRSSHTVQLVREIPSYVYHVLKLNMRPNVKNVLYFEDIFVMCKGFF